MKLNRKKNAQPQNHTTDSIISCNTFSLATRNEKKTEATKKKRTLNQLSFIKASNDLADEKYDLNQFL